MSGDAEVGLFRDVTVDDLMTAAVGTIYGDWDGDCEITAAELAALRGAIASQEYDAPFDYDCDGELTAAVELPAFLHNYTQQPPCGGGDSAGGGDGGDESSESYDDLEGLAEWLGEVLSDEQLEEFLADLAGAADEFADSPLGEEMALLLYYLE